MAAVTHSLDTGGAPHPGRGPGRARGWPACRSARRGRADCRAPHLAGGNADHPRVPDLPWRTPRTCRPLQSGARTVGPDSCCSCEGVCPVVVRALLHEISTKAMTKAAVINSTIVGAGALSMKNDR